MTENQHRVIYTINSLRQNDAYMRQQKLVNIGSDTVSLPVRRPVIAQTIADHLLTPDRARNIHAMVALNSQALPRHLRASAVSPIYVCKARNGVWLRQILVLKHNHMVLNSPHDFNMHQLYIYCH